MTTPTGFKTSITQYSPDTGKIVNIETTTTETTGLLNGKKAENLTAVIQQHKSITKALCYMLIPTVLLGVALLIASVIVWAKYGYDKFEISATLFIPSTCCLIIAASLTGAYLSHVKKPIVLNTLATTV